ncbi:unnamed protein product [Alopecurus aequalis]
MLHEKPYNRPDGTGIGADAGSGEWTPGKRPKHDPAQGNLIPGGYPSLHTEVRTSSSDSHPAEGDQEDPYFTMADLEDVIISVEESLKIARSSKKKPFVFVNQSCILDDESQHLVYERLVLYRLKAHKLSKGESIDKLDDEARKKELLPDFLQNETESIFQLHLDVDNYYKSLEGKEDGSVGWYFDPEFSKMKDLADYQRLVLKNRADEEYLDWKGYRLDFSTYNMDKEYVQFFTEMSEKLQWLKKYMESEEEPGWLEIKMGGCRHALKIATRYPRVTDNLVLIAYGEHIWSLRNDYLYCDDWDIIFLEIWKLVIKEQLDFTTAVMQVKEKNSVPRHEWSLLHFLKGGVTSCLQSRFYFCVEEIPHYATDKFAKECIKKKILNLHRKKTLHQYKLKKMEIAEKIGLHKDPSHPPLVIYGDDEYADFIMVNEAGQPIELAEPGSIVSLPSKMDHDLCSSQI